MLACRLVLHLFMFPSLSRGFLCHYILKFNLTVHLRSSLTCPLPLRLLIFHYLSKGFLGHHFPKFSLAVHLHSVLACRFVHHLFLCQFWWIHHHLLTKRYGLLPVQHPQQPQAFYLVPNSLYRFPFPYHQIFQLEDPQPLVYS